MLHIKEESVENHTRKKISVPVVISVLLTVIPLVTTSLITAWAIAHESMLRSWSLEYWVVISLILTVSSSLALTPPTFLALIYGYFLGWISLPLLFGLNLGAIAIIYGIAFFFHASSVRESLILVYPQAASMLRRFNQNELKLIFFAKLSPVLPFTITNLFFAVAGAKFRQVLVGGMLGMIPRTFLAVWAGREARDIRYLLEHPNEGLATKLVLILLIIVSTAGIGYLFKDRKALE